MCGSIITAKKSGCIFIWLKEQWIGIKALQSCMISQPMKSLTKHNFTKYTIKMVDHGQHPTIMYDVFLVYNVSIDWSESICYEVE